MSGDEEMEQALRDLGETERRYPDDGMSDRSVRIILRNLVRRVEALESLTDMDRSANFGDYVTRDYDLD